MSKKILYIWKGAYPWDVRTEKFCDTLSQNAYDVLLLARWNGEEQQNEIIHNIKISRVGFKQKSAFSLPIPYNPVWYYEIKKAIQSFKPDLIIVREIMLAESAGKLARKFNLPIIMDMAENYPAAMRDWKKYNSNAVSKFLVHNLKLPDITERKSLKFMNHIIAVCDEQIERLNSAYNYPAEKISIVHNTPSKKLLSGDNIIDSEKIIIGHHGYLSAEKSIKNFILGFNIAYKTRQDIEFHIWGDGECYSDYQEIVNTGCSCDSIQMHGNYNYSQIGDILNSVDLGVIPYQISDFNNYTIHNKIFDYFAVGKPVLVSEALPLQRIIRETNAGIIADCEQPSKIAEALIALDKSKLNKFGKNAYLSYLNKYNWKNDSEILINVVQRIIKEWKY